MDGLMTFTTKRNYIKTMFNCITIWMMIMLCLRITKRAFQKRWCKYFVSANSIMYCHSGFSYIGIKTKTLFYFETNICFSFFGLSIFLYSGLTFCTLPIAFFTCFALFTFFVFLWIKHNSIVMQYAELSITKNKIIKEIVH